MNERASSSSSLAARERPLSSSLPSQARSTWRAKLQPSPTRGGGTILLGVREDGTIPGVFGSDAQRALRSAIELLTPKPEALLTELPGPGGQTVGRIDVVNEPAGPVATPDGLFRRSDARIEALPADVIRERALRTVASDLKGIVAPLATTLESLTQRMLELERQIASAQTWRRRLPDILLGAGISAVLGLILALLFL
jgi:hypothetical protein